MMNKNINIEKNNPFRVPENYFDEFPGKVARRVSDTDGKKRARLYSLAKPHLMLAAAMIGFVIISYTGLKLILPDRETDFPDINLTEYAELLLYEIDDFFIINELTTVENYRFAESLDDEEIIEYLENEDIEYLTIIENL
ncbi:MAG TPA: hypothetical protein VMW76_00070 [Bacteroidales bacterium]|nr:hypothetical protein [Bacteroidales bacterium]